MSRFTVKAVNDDRDFCECCGKQGLKKVVWIEDSESGEVKHFGTTCATQPVKGFGCEKEIKKAIRTFEEQQWVLNRKAFRAYKAAGGKWEPSALSKGSYSPVDRNLYNEIRAGLSA